MVIRSRFIMLCVDMYTGIELRSEELFELTMLCDDVHFLLFEVLFGSWTRFCCNVWAHMNKFVNKHNIQ